MPNQLLIYQNAVPVSALHHATASVEAPRGQGFCKALNAVPLTTVEIQRAALEYCVVFVGEGAEFAPAVLLGLRDGENLFLDDQLVWDAAYVPAFVRRYPFAFASADGERLTLCVDDAYPGLNREGRGARLFDEAARPTTYVDGVLRFLRAYQAEFEASKRFCRKLVDLDLLEPMQAQATLAGGERRALGGFVGVSRERLQRLDDQTLGALAKSGELELIYLHLQSLHNIAKLKARCEKRQAQLTESFALSHAGTISDRAPRRRSSAPSEGPVKPGLLH